MLFFFLMILNQATWRKLLQVPKVQFDFASAAKEEDGVDEDEKWWLTKVHIVFSFRILFNILFSHICIFVICNL
jgi:hypothetical protein